MTRTRWHASAGHDRDVRLVAFRVVMIVLASVIGIKLFLLQVVDHDVYQALASGQHKIFQELFPVRGDILMHDLKDGTVVPLAANQQLAFVYADPRHIEDPVGTAKAIGEVFGYDEEKILALADRLDRPEDPYEPIEREVSDEVLAIVEALQLPGIEYVREPSRLYPEGTAGSHVVGFLGNNEDGTRAGKYGVEGYFDALLAGTPGFLRSERDISGRLIAIGDRSLEPAVDGSDIVLTIDRTIEYKACDALRRAVITHQADGGSVVIIEPSTGRILAMCGYPDFNPNHYGAAGSIYVFNNPAIFDSYEPGSVFKSITIAAALDAGAITPNSLFTDPGSIMIEDWPKPIANALGKVYGTITMTTALEESVNTAMIFAMRETGQDRFTEYVRNFGFGMASGVEMETESAGDVSALDKGSEIYAATASFGQGITVTPLQLAAAYGAIANGGMLKAPMIVDEIRHPDGTVEKREPVDVRRVIETKTSRLIGAMLVSVVEQGHGKRAGVPGYYIAGKTGTAQVPKKDGTGYEENANIGTFAGFGPVEDPKFAMIVRIDRPRDVEWAEASAAPLFGEIATFLLQYLEVPPTRPL